MYGLGDFQRGQLRAGDMLWHNGRRELRVGLHAVHDSFQKQEFALRIEEVQRGPCLGYLRQRFPLGRITCISIAFLEGRIYGFGVCPSTEKALLSNGLDLELWFNIKDLTLWRVVLFIRVRWSYWIGHLRCAWSGGQLR